MSGMVTVSATSVRKDFSDYFTTAALRGGVVEITRYDGNDRAYLVGPSILLSLATHAATDLLGSAGKVSHDQGAAPIAETGPLTICPEQTGGWTAYYRPLDVMAHADSEPEVLALLLARIRDYAELYIEDLPLYLADPNRRSHFPLLLGALLHKTDDAAMQFLHLTGQSTPKAPSSSD